MSCPSCQSEEVVEDFSRTLVQHVCVNCGTVVTVESQFKSADEDRGSFQNSSGFFATGRSNTSSLKYHTTKHKARSATYINARSVIQDLATECGIPKYMKDEAIQLFEDAANRPQLKFIHADKKSMLAGSCFYVTVRKHGWPISVSYVSTFLRVPTFYINEAFKQLTEELSINVQAPDPEEMIVGFVQQLKVNELNNTEIINKMKQVLHLSKFCLLSSGVGRQQLLIAVCYVCWCSVNARKHKPKSFSEFCKFYKLTDLAGPTASKRVNELVKMLIDVSRNIPSLKDVNVDKKSIFWHVETILKFPRLSMQCSSHGDEAETYTFQRISTKRKRCDDDDNEAVVDRDLDDPDVGELDIPDSEMHKYLRCDEEIEYVKSICEKTLPTVAK